MVVSNRAPVEVSTSATGERRVKRTVGGLATALDDVVRARGGVWVAWAGPVEDGELPPEQTGLPYPIRAVALGERDLEHYYGGFANQVLWPLCHYFPTLCRFEGSYWTAYRHANERFAAATRAVLAPDDVVWVNDFHLCLVPGLLRTSAPTVRIGVFWHIPFPPPSVFGICQWRSELLAGLLGADVIGFQTDDDVRNFLACVREHLGMRVHDDPPHVSMGPRRVRIRSLPIGIDAARFATQARDPAVRAEGAELRRTLGAERVLIGVDRLDYTKGVVERLLGFERFLERHPAWRRSVCLVQITVPSRFRVPQYREMKRHIDETVGRIVGRFTHAGRSPRVYRYSALDHERLAAYYSAADVALVTPLRDGMNLVAKEYVACHPDGDGTLVLSEFAGAARTLREAVLVNPYESDAIAHAIEAAVSMHADERARRMRALVRTVATYDVHWWTSSFLGLLESERVREPAAPVVS